MDTSSARLVAGTGLAASERGYVLPIRRGATPPSDEPLAWRRHIDRPFFWNRGCRFGCAHCRDSEFIYFRNREVILGALAPERLCPESIASRGPPCGMARCLQLRSTDGYGEVSSNRSGHSFPKAPKP